MTSILVRREGALGDVIEVTAITERLRAENPDALIDIETRYPNVFFKNPHVAHPTRTKEVYDRVIDLNGAFEKRLRKDHPIDAYSEVAFGDRKTPHRLTFKWDPLPGRIRTLVGERYIVLHPARSWPIRTLPKEFWQEVVHKLTERGCKVVVTGTAQDWPLTGVLDLRGGLSLAGQAALIDGAKCFICSESGPMILSQVTQTYTVTLTTMVPPEHVDHEGWQVSFIEADVPCVGCAAKQPAETTYFDCMLGHRNCLTAFDPAHVVEIVEQQQISKDIAVPAGKFPFR